MLRVNHLWLRYQLSISMWMMLWLVCNLNLVKIRQLKTHLSSNLWLMEQQYLLHLRYKLLATYKRWWIKSIYNLRAVSFLSWVKLSLSCKRKRKALTVLLCWKSDQVVQIIKKQSTIWQLWENIAMTKASRLILPPVMIEKYLSQIRVINLILRTVMTR